MKKLEKLKEFVEKLHEPEAERMSDQPVQYWNGGDWQAQGLERAYSNILKEIDKLINE